MARIIAIEDSPVLQRLLAITMRSTDVEIEAYLDGSGGLEAALANPPELVVLDLGLPDMSGWTVLEQLRSDPATLETPVIITTGETRGSVSDRATMLDAVTLEKPYTGAVLRSTILMLIEERSMTESLS
ncbi:MAG: response regulator [Actinomycetota bacterium]|nr:response regulator [Actinomycetota bacterium]